MNGIPEPMINPQHNPIQWALLIEELSEAHDHLGKLISEMATDTEYDESRLRVDMGHIVAHLNRAWARRNCTRDLTDEEWDAFREYPQDLLPIA